MIGRLRGVFSGSGDCATAGDLFRVGLQTTEATIRGVEKPVKIRELSGEHGLEVIEYQKLLGDKPGKELLLMAKVVILGCPAFARYDVDTVRASCKRRCWWIWLPPCLIFQGWGRKMPRKLKKSPRAALAAIPPDAIGDAGASAVCY